LKNETQKGLKTPAEAKFFSGLFLIPGKQKTKELQ